nr:hypothetical protein CFP56_31617 [Quercus suber]
MSTNSSGPAGLPLSDSTRSFWHTQPSSLLMGHRSTRNLPSTADVVIIGSGITGAGAAHHLLNDDSQPKPNDGNTTAKGLHVVMLEAREACWGATGRNGGHCAPALLEHVNDQSIAQFELDNFKALTSLIEAKKIQCEFVAQGSALGIYSSRGLAEIKNALDIIQSNAPDLREMVKLVQEPVELKDLRLRPGTGFGGDGGAIAAIVTDTAARLWPYKLIARILEDLLLNTPLEARATFNLQTLTPVQSLNQIADGRWSVSTERGNILAKKVILATNGYTSHLLPSFSDLIVPCRGQMSALLPTPSLHDANRLQTSYGFHGAGLDDYLIQRPSEAGSHLMFGGGRRLGPSLNTVDDSVIDPKVATYLRSRLLDVFTLPSTAEDDHASHKTTQNSKPELTAVNEWTGIMGYSRDHLPWVGPVPASLISSSHQAATQASMSPTNLFIAAGYTGHGMPNGWLCGKAVALMAAAEGGELDINAAQEKVKLPKAYVITEDRVKRARAGAVVAASDDAEMQRGAALRGSS